MSFALLRHQALKPRALPQIYCSLSRACYHGTPQYDPMRGKDQCELIESPGIDAMI